MSILQEYAEIRNRIGEDRYNKIILFLNKHNEYLLSDVYYKESDWNKMIKEYPDNINNTYK